MDVSSSSHGPARQLSHPERVLLASMLSVDDLADADAFQDQVATTTATASCTCGCGSIQLLVDRSRARVAAQQHPAVVVDGDVFDEQGRVVGGLLLFQRGGWLTELEVYSAGGEPLQLPSPNKTALRVYSEDRLRRPRHNSKDHT